MSWLIEKWDNLIYRLACGTMRRKCERNAGFTYLLELTIRDYRIKQDMSQELMRSTEVFFEVMQDLGKL